MEFFFDDLFFLKGLLIVSIELLIVLHEQTVFFAVAMLHLVQFSLLVLFPAAHIVLDISLIVRWQAAQGRAWRY